jgi:hypothetical protein
MKNSLMHGFLMIISTAILITACRKRDALLPDNLVNFETANQGLNASEDSIKVKMKLSRPTDRDVKVTINFTPHDLVYGTDFITSPTMVSNTLTLTVPSGNNETSVTVKKIPGVLFDGDEKLIMEIHSSEAPVYIGATKQFTLNFSELVANSASATINGGGATYPNKVFIDLSANRQVAVNRGNWDLGFYTGNDDFRVVLNSSSAMMAKGIDRTDLSLVTIADTIGFSGDVVFSQTAPTTSSLAYIDHPSGDLSRTAISSISATANENKVYIINRGFAPGSPAPARGWKKVRVIRNASGGYTLQHADIAATTFQEINIMKDGNYFFKYISFESGAVEVEPAKKKWDLAWTYFSNATNFGTGEVPYLFQDIILQNRNVEVARVMSSTTTFENFTETDLAGLTFSSTQTTIGADWRSGGGPGTAPAVRTDRFYIIRDGDNNYYKLRFTALTQNGVRGYPAVEFVLVKRG